MTTTRYLWAHPIGRVALLVVAIGVIGLTLRYWTAVPLLLCLPRREVLR